MPTLSVTAPIIRIKTKYQVTLPPAIREEAGLSVGDFLEAQVEGKKITLTPKNAIDRELALAIKDIEEGRVHGPFRSVKEMLRELHRKTKKPAIRSQYVFRHAMSES